MGPFQRSFCLLFISLVAILYFMRPQKNHFPYLPQNSSSLFASFEKRDGAPGSREIFDVLKFLNSSFCSTKKSRIVISDRNISERIYILGLFDLTSKLGEPKDARGELMGAKTAVRHVNALNILPGYELVLLVNDTQCDTGVAIDRLFHAIYSNHTILMLLGAGCSNVSEALAHIVPYWNIIQVSYGSKSPTLSDRRKFPIFFRTVAPESTHNIAKTHFIKRHSWQVVAAFTQSENEYLLPINHLIKELEKENVSCMSTVTFSMDNYKEQLNLLKRLDVRIIIGSFSVEMAPRIFCTAYQLKIYGNEYVWILENQNVFWWEQSQLICQSKELKAAAEGIILIGDHESNFYNPLWDEANFSLKYAKQSYDAVWTMALTLTGSRINTLKKFNYGRNDIALRWFEIMKKLEFVGLSGPIKFRGADRVGDFDVSQVQDSLVVNVALYDSINDQLLFDCKFCNEIRWKNGQVPIAQRILKITFMTIPKGTFYTISAISGLGIICSMVFLYFNLKFRQIKTVKLTSPNLNNLTVIGCILVYLSVLLFGCTNIDAGIGAYFDLLCSARIYLLSAGFSLTFGSMFAKSYKVHRLFAYSTTSLVRNKLLRDRQLIGLILVPLIVDTLIMALWITTDPLKRHLHDLQLVISEEDPTVACQPQVELCRCHNTIGWHIALFGYKTVIIISSVYMAWKTRNVKIAALNDSQYIGICVYSAVFSIVIVVVFSFVTEYFIISFIAKSASILVSATITLMLMFGPKLKSVFGRVDTELSIMNSMGLKMQCNTRRFITEDPKEVLLRLEIQNRVYRGQLESLDKEIVRLENILKDKSVPQVFPEIHCLKVPRASWPTSQRQPIKAFASEGDVKPTAEKANFFDMLKQFFGSLTSLQYSYNNLEDQVKNAKPSSNPEISCQQVALCSKNLEEIKSESCIGNLY